ncbi:MAG: hypothetical protein VB997_00050 [Opitutales bacterium]
MLPPFLFFFLCVGHWIFFSYRPFEAFREARKRGDPVALIPEVKDHAELMEFIYFKDPSIIFLPNQFTVGNPIATSGLPLAPGMEPYPPSFYASDPWLYSRQSNDGYSAKLEAKALSMSLMRRPFSTFGRATPQRPRKTKPVPSMAWIYAVGEKLPAKIIPLKAEFWTQHGGELWGATEFLFTLRDNVMAGPPAPSKSSGSETVDDALGRYLMELEPSLGLRDGYYRFVAGP